MNKIPVELIKSVSKQRHTEVNRWWSSLEDDSQKTLEYLFSKNASSVRYSLSQKEGGTPEWHRLPIYGRFEEPQFEEDDSSVWPNYTELYDFIVNHELEFPQERKFHICSACEAPRAAVKSGYIPHHFSCPLDRGCNCPMKKLLSHAPGKSVRLSLCPFKE